VKQIPWVRVLLEGMVIVVSILLAFGIDAWWDRARNHDLRSAYLTALKDEFESAAAEMSDQIGDHRSQLARIEGLLAGLAEGVPEDSILPLLNGWGTYVYNPYHPVLDDLANSASVEMLGIPELRFDLLRYRWAKDFLTVMNDRERRLSEQLLHPFLLENTDLAQYHIPVVPSGGEPRFDSGVEALYDNRYLQNLLIRRRSVVASQLSLDEQVMDTIERVLARVDAVIQ
jgi:hypothetical protein